MNLGIVYFLVNHGLNSIAPSQLAYLGLDRVATLQGLVKPISSFCDCDSWFEREENDVDVKSAFFRLLIQASAD